MQAAQGKWSLLGIVAGPIGCRIIGYSTETEYIETFRSPKMKQSISMLINSLGVVHELFHRSAVVVIPSSLLGIFSVSLPSILAPLYPLVPRCHLRYVYNIIFPTLYSHTFKRS